ncbi:sensor histidine kinase [Fusibacter sp. 3D3]|uniref:sensor histidine kinase n=1 Tax=Fusibacter sp. 3D3 TaxID=1048380 RepID=UPI000853B6EA|nr:sensor histidine kinase [Fusibacter sp. 3D3]GAU79390.1 autolysin sensor kinase [Fusibacter sp. 3D3]
MNSKFKNLPLKTKLLYFFLPISIIPMVLFSFFVASMYEQTLEKRTAENIFDNSALISNQIETIINNMVNCSNAITFNINSVYDDYASKELYTPIQYEMDLNRVLYSSKIVYPEADAIAFLNQNDQLFFTDAQMDDNFTKLYTSSILKELAITTGKSIWFDISKRDYLTLDSEVPVLTLGKKIIHIKSGKTLGYLLINVKEDTLSNAFNHQKIQYEIIKNKQIIASYDNRKVLTDLTFTPALSKSYSKKQIEGKNYIYAFSPIHLEKAPHLDQWFLMARTPLDDLNSDLRSTLILLASIVLLCIFIELLIANVFSTTIIKPFDYMITQMKSIGNGNFDIEIEIDSKDEIGVFAKTFNKMSKKIQRLLIEVEEKEQKKRTYELALLQEQVKPHFLYNTLDTIYAMNELGLKNETRKGIKALADFYRKTLSNGSETVTVKEELEALREYLFLLKLQYEDAFDYSIELSDEIASEEMIKLLLQPLVENAIYHGLKPLQAKGHLKITAFKETQNIVFEIIDNGIGIQSDTLKELLTYAHQTHKDHFGIYSIVDRLKLCYGDSARLEIHSQVGLGTHVRLTLPLQSPK